MSRALESKHTGQDAAGEQDLGSGLVWSGLVVILNESNKI
jgi:hypothetical protein